MKMTMPTARKRETGRGSSLCNSMIPEYAAALGSEMQADLEYLCSLAENVPLPMFPCSIEISAGIAILDIAAMRVYISLSYATRVKLPIQSTTEFILQMSERRRILT